MSESADSGGWTTTAQRPGLAGMRAAMYGEMAKSIAGQRPPMGHEEDWDTALEAAIGFIESCGLGEQLSRQLLSEACVTRRVARRSEWEPSAEETCLRLAVAFRRQVRER